MGTHSDKRILRTRELLLDAFHALISVRGYHRITVKNVLDRAGVGRATFYAHFRNKEELLTASLGRLRTGLQRAWNSAATNNGSELLGFILPFYQHIDSHRRIYHLSVIRSPNTVVEKQSRRMLSDLVREDFLKRPRAALHTEIDDAVVEYVSAAIWSLGCWWIKTNAGISAEELAELLRKLVLPGLKAS